MQPARSHGRGPRCEGGERLDLRAALGRAPGCGPVCVELRRWTWPRPEGARTPATGGWIWPPSPRTPTPRQPSGRRSRSRWLAPPALAGAGGHLPGTGSRECTFAGVAPLAPGRCRQRDVQPFSGSRWAHPGWDHERNPAAGAPRSPIRQRRLVVALRQAGPAGAGPTLRPARPGRRMTGPPPPRLPGTAGGVQRTPPWGSPRLAPQGSSGDPALATTCVRRRGLREDPCWPPRGPSRARASSHRPYGPGDHSPGQVELWRQERPDVRRLVGQAEAALRGCQDTGKTWLKPSAKSPGEGSLTALSRADVVEAVTERNRCRFRSVPCRSGGPSRRPDRRIRAYLFLRRTSPTAPSASRTRVVGSGSTSAVISILAR